MMRAALLLSMLLAGCAGQATYDIRPFYDEASKQVLCCAATITNGKDIATVSVHAKKTADGYTLDFTETGVGATAPITAQSQATAAVAGAVSSAAAAAIKLAP
ncbi:hypothetical protein [Paraburkholderia tagetis]|uniref:Lipoprotein n=1 Tax=Paraburkholderia tagetis TaxID=2913261 RepID=A0A9X1RMK0_9BURK|nr:hypothetical protein [Paraburkholderia tagetis]MCG5072302.1 hypothetical protein [Paraburkholderia tagetis]